MGSQNSRIADRRPLDTRIKVIPPSGPGFDAEIDDVSTGGLAILFAEPLNRDSICHVYFLLPLDDGLTLVQARCRVAESRPTEMGGRYRIGLQFVDFVSDETAALRAIAQYTAAPDRG